MTESVRSFVSGRRLIRSVTWNLFGIMVPLLVGLVAIPLLIEGMGKERFGLLALIWMGVGYFSVFDMGLGRALTRLVAERLGAGRTEDLHSLIWTALAVILFLGVVGALAMLLVAAPLVRYVFNVDSALHAEAVGAFRLLALGLPVVVLTSALTGLLEAHQRFASIAAIRLPLGVLGFAGPLFILQFTPSLVWATGALLSARIVAAVAFFFVAAIPRKELLSWPNPTRDHVGPLFRFGGWLTVTNIVGPIMVYFDRFFIGATLNMTAVTYYVTPYEIVSRAQILPQAVMAVLFPAMTTVIALGQKQVADLYKETTRALFLLVLPVAAAFFLLAPEALELWLGDDFRDASTPVVLWLALGLLMNTLARMPFTLLQSAGRPDLVAIVHLAEVLPYALLLWWLTTQLGIEGTALAWFIRVLADAVILNEIARRQIPEINSVALEIYALLCFVLLVFAVLWLVEPLPSRLAIFILIVGVVGIGAWQVLGKLRQLRIAADSIPRRRARGDN